MTVITSFEFMWSREPIKWQNT